MKRQNILNSEANVEPWCLKVSKSGAGNPGLTWRQPVSKSGAGRAASRLVASKRERKNLQQQNLFNSEVTKRGTETSALLK